MTTTTQSALRNDAAELLGAGAQGSVEKSEPCCAPKEQESCCDASAKAGCCGTPEATAEAPSKCGCR
jgi:hypothetical protein